MQYGLNRTWAEVNLDSLEHNFNEFIRITKRDCSLQRVKIMAVVKANAYGHGAVTAAKSLVEIGADYLAVASLDEAIELRKAQITTPVLVLGYIAPHRNMEIIQNDITSTVYSEDNSKELSKTAAKCGEKLKIHIKIDTGMTRLGFKWDNAFQGIKSIYNMPGLEVEGLFTHFSSADEADSSYTDMQFERFMSVADELDKEGITIPLKHVCNSAASINYPRMHLDMIRPGISLYGCYPAGEQGIERQKINLKPVMSLKTEIIHVNNVDAGVFVGYGRTYKTSRQSRLATIQAGYADGFSRMLSGKACAIIKGRKVPVAGRICMDQCVVDITDVKSKVAVGDEAVLMGEQAGRRISADDIAGMLGTINYEVLCMVSKRVPRYYFRGGQIVGVENYLI